MHNHALAAGWIGRGDLAGHMIGIDKMLGVDLFCSYAPIQQDGLCDIRHVAGTAHKINAIRLRPMRHIFVQIPDNG